ncbi:MAG TPA: glycosyltransferase family 9 protein [Dongiaceae bacterium]
MSGSPATIATAVILPNWIGDGVMATPALQALRDAAGSGGRIEGFGPPSVCELLAGHPALNAIHRLPAGRGLSGSRAFALATQLRAGNFDRIVLLSNGLAVALAAWLAGIPQRIGYDRRGRGIFLTDARQPPREGGRLSPIPAIDYYLALVQAPGATRPAMMLATSAQDEAGASSLLSIFADRPDHPLVILNNNAARSSAKLWPAEAMAGLARRIAETFDVNVMILGAPGLEDHAHRMSALANHPRVRMETPAGLGAVKASIRRASLMVSTDSGPRSIAAAFNIPLVSLFGPTDPRWTLLHVPTEIMIEAEDHRMAALPVERVWAAVRGQLEQHRTLKTVP